MTSSRKPVTFGILCGLFLSAIEISVVGTAAPRIAEEIGGIKSYSWMFTTYLLAATVFMPLWGRLADHYGRKKFFLASILIFLFGSLGCGFSQNMTQLIIARGIKGIGGGGLFPLAFTLVADLYSFKERSRVQGYLSSVWGVGSLVGPFVGGVLTDIMGWRAIFFINLAPGALSAFLIWHYLKEPRQKVSRIKLSPAPLLSSALFSSLLILATAFWQENAIRTGSFLFLAGVAVFFLYLSLEKNASDPLFPAGLIRNRVFAMSSSTGFFISMMVIGLGSFGPLYFQKVLGYSPTASGLLLAPFTVAWVIGSMISTKMLHQISYRKLLIFGNSLTLAGILLFMSWFDVLNFSKILVTMLMMGFGMSFNYPIALITTQHSVEPNQVGFATSGLAWIRHLGTTLGTGAMGLTLALLHHPASMEGGMNSLRNALFGVFCIKTGAVMISFFLTFLFPRVLPERKTSVLA